MQAMRRVWYQNSQSEAHPERDAEFFTHIFRATGSRDSARNEAKAFRRLLRSEQRDADKRDADKAVVGGEGQGAAYEGRYFKAFPDSLIFLFRVIGLLRGLCTTLSVRVSYARRLTHRRTCAH